LTIPDQSNALTADEGAETARQLNMNPQTADSVEDAISSIMDESRGSVPGRILICGSLYLVGHVLKTNG